MAFLDPIAAGAGDSNLYVIIFTQFLKMTPCLSPSIKYGCFTGNVTHDLIFNLFLPHILIAGFILTFVGAGIIKHRGMQMLLGIATYAIIIQMGWYGFLASTMVWWFIIIIIFALMNFITGGIFHPTRFEEMYKRGYLKGLSKEDKKRAARLRKQLTQINARITQEENRPGGERPKVMEKLVDHRHSLEIEISNLEGK